MKKLGSQRAPLTSLRNNPKNPRVIKDDKFEKLVASIREFPEMLDVRPIVCTPDGMVLGGNMRLRACIEAGLQEVAIHVVSWEEAKQEQFIIKDNIGYGEWDWDILANEWDPAELESWGLDVWKPGEDINLDEFFDENQKEDPKDNASTLVLEYTAEEYAEITGKLDVMGGTREKVVFDLVMAQK